MMKQSLSLRLATVKSETVLFAIRCSDISLDSMEKSAQRFLGHSFPLSEI